MSVVLRVELEVFMPRAHEQTDFRVVFQVARGVDGAFWNGFRLFTNGRQTGAYDSRAWSSYECAVYSLLADCRFPVERGAA